MGIVNYTYNRSSGGGDIITHLINASDGQGLHFDGAANTYVDCGDTTILDGATRISVEAIFSTTATSMDILIAKEYVDFAYRLSISAGIVSFVVGNGVGTTHATAATSGTHNDGNPKHVVGTWDNATLSIYINGNLEGTAAFAGGSIPNTADKLALGAHLKSDDSNVNNFEGIIYRARLWKKSLTATEVTASYENATVPFSDQYSSTASPLMAGTLTSGKLYRINTYVSGDDFANLGGTNVTGNEFVTTGTTPTTWSNGSSLIQIGCTADYDLSFANPSPSPNGQSLMVRDRASAADGTSSATGVVQVTPIEQLNAKAARIGTSVATPADGELLVSGKIVVDGLDIYHGLGGDTDSTAVGDNALDKTTAGAVQNTAIGANALTEVVSTDGNTAVGCDVLPAFYGNFATVVGFNAGENATTAANLVAIGKDAASNLRSGDSNTCIGVGSMGSLLGDNNTALGYAALQDDCNADNAAVGKSALAVFRGSDAVAVGASAGSTITTATDCTLLGKSATASATSGTANQTVIGASTTGVADNSVTLGNADVTAIYAAQDSGATIHCAGVTSSGVLDLPAGSAGAPALIFNGDTNTGLYQTAADGLGLSTAATLRFSIDSAGKVAIAATPSAWKASWPALDIGQSGSLYSQDNNTTGLGSNLYFNGTSWFHKNTGLTALYQLGDGAHYFYGNASASAGATFTPTARFTISATGDAGLGGTPSVVANKTTLTTNHATWGGRYEVALNGTVKSAWDWGTSGTTNFGSVVAEPLVLLTNSAARLTIDSAGVLTLGLTDATINTGTSNGSDTHSILIDSGATSSSRGAYAQFCGNQHASLGGKLLLQTGNSSEAATAGVYIRKDGGVDSVIAPATGGIYEVGGVLKENLLTNSGFDVWSNSTLENATGTNLQTAATWQNYASLLETFTTSGADITSAIETGGGSAYPRSNVALGLVVGKLYKIVATLTHTSGVAPSLRKGVGGDYTAIDFPATSLAVGANTIVFEHTSGDYLWMYTNGNTNYSCTFVVTEVVPGCVAATLPAMDGWEKTNLTTVKLYREHEGSNTKAGSFYSTKLVNTRTAGGGLYWQTQAGTDRHNMIPRFAGRIVTFGAWLKQDTANEVKLGIEDSDGYVFSTVTATTGSFVWHEVTRTIASDTTVFKVYFSTAGGDTSTTSYISQPILSLGSAIGSGNYSRPMGEIVWCEKEISSNTFNGGFSDVAATTLNVESDSNGKIPKGAKAVYMQGWGQDSGSAGTDCYFHTRQSATSGWMGTLSPAGLANDAYARAQMVQPCNSDGDFDYIIEATGSGTFETAIGYRGVQLR